MVNALDRLLTYLFQKTRRVPGFPPVHDWITRRVGRWRATDYDVTDTVVVCGSPRSGTTWLAELLATLPGTEIVLEPLDPERHPEASEEGLHMNMYLPPSEDAPSVRKYVDGVLRGKVKETGMLHKEVRLGRLLAPERLIVKCVRGNRLLPWIEEQFDVSSVLLLRHPCAVVSSQLRFPGGWDEMKQRVEEGDIRTQIDEGEWVYPNTLLENAPQLRSAYSSIKTVEQFLAFEWAVDALIPLRSSSSSRRVVSYEQLVMQGREQLECLFQFLDEHVPEAAHRRLGIPSQTTKSRSNVAKGGNPLTTWQDHLEDAQVEQILGLVHEAGIDFYDRSEKPDLDWLERQSRDSSSTVSSSA